MEDKTPKEIRDYALVEGAMFLGATLFAVYTIAPELFFAALPLLKLLAMISAIYVGIKSLVDTILYFQERGYERKRAQALKDVEQLAADLKAARDAHLKANTNRQLPLDIEQANKELKQLRKQQEAEEYL